MFAACGRQVSGAATIGRVAMRLAGSAAGKRSCGSIGHFWIWNTRPPACSAGPGVGVYVARGAAGVGRRKRAGSHGTIDIHEHSMPVDFIKKMAFTLPMFSHQNSSRVLKDSLGPFSLREKVRMRGSKT